MAHSPSYKKPSHLSVDFSDLKKLLKQIDLRVQKKDCPYCEKRMVNSRIEQTGEVISSLENGIHFQCTNCAYSEDVYPTQEG